MISDGALSVLFHCLTRYEHLSNSIDAAVLDTSGEALDWILTADKLRLNDLKEQCAEKIATDFVVVEKDLCISCTHAMLLNRGLLASSDLLLVYAVLFGKDVIVR